MAPRSKNILTFLPVFLSAASFLLVLLVLVSGVNNGLADLFFLKTNVANLKLPSALSGSEELRGLSEASGIDWVGEDLTASSLGLADEYTISLLTSCARTASGPSCSAPRVGFWFNPGIQLRLDASGLGATYPPEYRDALASYNKAAYFIAFSFVFCTLLLGLSAILGALGATILASASAISTAVTGMVVLAALFLLAGNAAAVHVFRRVADTFNAAFADQGLSASVGLAAILLGWLAFVLTLTAAIVLVLRQRGDSVTRGRRMSDKTMFGDFNSSAGDPMNAGMLAKGGGATREPKGLLGRIPLLGRHKYAQIGGKPALGLSTMPPPQQQQRGTDDDWSTEYENPRMGSPVRGVAEYQIPGGKPQAKPQRAPMAYEPYSNALQ
ncbi:hypothetical protein GGTG_10605 [Gaeumannomyces tritici R3-111a-1]|uniref:Integral membrane protein n=1 Tax=Gaeumannomyces tritici (strain R3-111a-1) TaxID=644352 RepID=J3PAT0_GAET3|nr:hypothetical protein GGTG_10605 [Gaeumannomyces tritici R3-111a-1]EJT71346.1 hypothetical protein GGTG_10605 [Gaeumannomyces tritici R3-111a-1]